MKRFVLVLLMLFMFGATGFGQEYRQFEGSNGKIIEAEFIKIDGDIVHLKLKNGKESRVKMDLFSKNSQAEIKNGFKNEGTDDPFGAQVSETLPNGQVIRISLNIDEYGNCKVRIEKTSEAAKNMFEGREIKVLNLPKTKIKMNDKGITNIIRDFKDADSTLLSIFATPGAKIDEEAKMLIFDPSVNQGAMPMMAFAPGQFKFPFEVICDVAKFNGELFNIEIIFDKPEKIEVRSILTCQVSSKSGVAGPYTVHCRWGKTVKGKGWVFQDIVRKNNQTFDKPFENGFRIPVPNGKITDVFRTSIGKNLNSLETPPTDLAPIGITRLEFAAPFTPYLGIGFKEDNSKILCRVGQNSIGAKSGIQRDDILISINSIKPKNLQVAEGIMKGISFDEPLTLKIERGGKQHEIVIIEK